MEKRHLMGEWQWSDLCWQGYGVEERLEVVGIILRQTSVGMLITEELPRQIIAQQIMPSF